MNFSFVLKNRQFVQVVVVRAKHFVPLSLQPKHSVRALNEVFTLDRAEKFLFQPKKSLWSDIDNLKNILTYVLTEQEIYDALMKAYKDKKDGIVGHLECANGLEECIKENADERYFLEFFGYEMIQEEY